VKVLRFRITTVLALIAIAAFDLAAIRTLVAYRDYMPLGELIHMCDLLLVGALPMANVLVFSMLAGLRRFRSSPFFLGFEVFGAMALSFFVMMTIFFDRIPWLYVQPVVNYLLKNLWQYGIFVHLPAVCSAAAAMLVLPQVAFALIGGFLFRRFRIAITPR
jgi:hypothetical protein